MEDFEELRYFFNHLLLLRDRSAPLDACEFRVNLRWPDANPYINLWIRRALVCQVRVLHIFGDDHELHNQPLSSKHLTMLKLCCVQLSRSFLDFSSCLALEDLEMRACCIRADRMSCPSLKRLHMEVCAIDCDVRTCRVSVPSLLPLYLVGYQDTTTLLESMPSLVTAHFTLDHAYECSHPVAAGNDNEEDSILSFEGLSIATHLELLSENAFFRRGATRCPMFSNLKTLFLEDWCMGAGLHTLAYFLRQAPIIEKLTRCHASTARTLEI